jgi:hypothetical protein
LYLGTPFNQNTGVLIPNDERALLAIWCFGQSGQMGQQVRAIDQSLKVTNATVGKIAFDLAHWQKVAAEKYPNGLPKPHSDDPTQWLFNGHPKVAGASSSGIPATIGSGEPRQDAAATLAKVAAASSRCLGIGSDVAPNRVKPDPPRQDAAATLQVAVARLLGYRWPRQTGSSFPDCPALGPDGLEQFADTDGIVCLNAIKGEQPAAERLRELLVTAFKVEAASSRLDQRLDQRQDAAATISQLLADVGYKTLEEWLRNGFFEQHCQLFHQRPFIWQIWDGLRDGFSALVNYHRLDRPMLEKLTYTYLGDWIARQKAAVAAGEEGSDAKLAATQELKAALERILEGEPPYDIFVRWKQLEKQPIGWDPDLNDGVRLNIRPFMSVPDVGKKGAGVLRWKPNVKWEKDRGKDVPSAPWFKVFKGDRINDHHLTLAEKRKVRGA